MCGIIAVVRRPSERRPPTGGEITGVLADAHRDLDGLAGSLPEPRRLDQVSAGIAGVDRLLRGAPGMAALAGDPALTSESPTWSGCSTATCRPSRPRSTRSRPTSPCSRVTPTSRRSTPPWSTSRTRCGPSSTTGCAPRAEVRRLAGPEPSRRRPVQLPVHPGGAVGPRPPRGPGPRLGRAARAGARPRARPASRRGGAPSWPPAAPTRCSRSRRGPRGRRAHLSFVYKAAAEIGELGDNTAALRGRHPRRRPAAPGAAAPTARGHGARPHPLGQRRDHLPGQRPPPQLRGARTGPTAPTSSAALNGDVDNYADLRGRRGAAHPRRDHHRRQGHPDPRVPPPARRVRPGRGLPARRSPRFEGSVAIGASSAAEPDDLLPGPARQRPGALRRPGRGRLRRGQRALRRWSRRPRPYLRMDGETPATQRPERHPWPAGPPRGARPARSRASSGLAYDGTPLPVARRRAGHRRDHHPRHRPGRLPPLPAQGDLRGAGVVPQDAAGQGRSSATAASQVRLGDDTLPAALRPGLRGRAHPADPGHRPGHRRGRRPEPGRGHRGAAVADDRVESRAVLATELSGFGLADDMSDTLVVAVSQSGTTTDTNRTVDLVRARGGRVVGRRQPPQQRPGRQVRRRALHLRRARRRDERGLDQGVLRPDRRRLPARPWPSPTRSAVRPGHPVDARARRPAGPARRHATQVLGPAREPSPRPRPAAGAAAAATGRWSATGPTASPPPRSGSSCPSSATSRSPATPPRTRSTSTCRRSR